MVEELQFKVGEDMGLRLMEISNEHLLYSNDLDKAMRVFQQSFGGGCPDEILSKLISGEMVCGVDVGSQEFLVGKREEFDTTNYPAKVDFEEYFEDKQKQMDEYCEEIEEGFDVLTKKFRYADYYNFQFSSSAVMKFIYGNDEDMIEEIHEDFELNQMALFIKVVKEFIEKSMQLYNMSNRIKGMYPDLDIDFNTYELFTITKKVQDIAQLNFAMFAVEEDYPEVTAYLEAAKGIDEVVSSVDGIEPVDILDNYSAGWLSPEGEYYGLNGEIANMLHNQIGDALQKKGLIPLYESEEGERYFFKDDNAKLTAPEISPDAWLEQQGWVKIHGNNINFGGCLNVKINKQNVNMTNVQIDMIRDYINDCHQCIIRAGWRMTRESVNRFTVLAKTDPIALNKKYFTFD